METKHLLLRVHDIFNVYYNTTTHEISFEDTCGDITHYAEHFAELRFKTALLAKQYIKQRFSKTEV